MVFFQSRKARCSFIVSFKETFEVAAILLVVLIRLANKETKKRVDFYPIVFSARTQQLGGKVKTEAPQLVQRDVILCAGQMLCFHAPVSTFSLVVKWQARRPDERSG